MGGGDDKHLFPWDIFLQLSGGSVCASFFLLFLLLFLSYLDRLVYKICRKLTTPIGIKHISLPPRICFSHSTRIDLLKTYIQ